MIEQGLYQLITADSSITSLATGGVYWILAPKGAIVPYIVLNRVATTDTHTVDGAIGLRGALFQVDCYATTYYAARAISVAVRSLIGSYTGNLPDTDSTDVDGIFTEKDWDMPYEEGAKGFVFRALLEFRVWYYEPTS
jgi:hypothetical protein